jgi:hypothetical protein
VRFKTAEAVVLASLLHVLAACGSERPPPLGDDFSSRVDAGPDGTAPLVLPVVAQSDDPTTCEEAAMLRSYVGCDYWPTVVANDVWSVFDFAVVVANAGTTPAAVTITGPAGLNQSKTVLPNSLQKFYLPWVPSLKSSKDADTCGDSAPLESSVVAKAGAFHLVSSVPITVYQFSALEYASFGGPPCKDWSSCPGLQTCTEPDGTTGTLGCYSFSNDSSLLLPSTAMTGNYRVAGFPGQTGIDPNGKLPPMPQMGSYFAVTATANGTHVSVQLSAKGDVLAGGAIPATAGGGLIQLTLDAGDVGLFAGGIGDTFDLSGSLVSADQPVQVISGSPCAEIPEGTPACDHLEQSVFPAETLGRRYFVAAPTGPAGLGVERVVRLYGNVDGTTLTYVPSVPGCPATLDAGQVGDCGIVKGDFEVMGTHEFAVGSFMLGGSLIDPSGGLGDPSQSFMAAVEQYRTKYVFLAPNDYVVNYADIVGPIGAQVVLDNVMLPANRASTIGDGYGVLRVPLEGFNPAGGGSHVLLASAPIGLQVLGYGSFTSYQYPGGLNLKHIAPPPPPTH